MREKIFEILKKTYGILMSISFFAGIVPLFFFLIAIIAGGSFGEKMAIILYDHVYPYIILLASVAVVIGLIATYVKKKEEK